MTRSSLQLEDNLADVRDLKRISANIVKELRELTNHLRIIIFEANVHKILKEDILKLEFHKAKVTLRWHFALLSREF